MIGNWLTHIRNMLIIACRQNRCVAFIKVLNSYAENMKSELDSFISDARMRSATTWQVCWLEKLLNEQFEGEITITEADGLPVDFIVSGISYQDQNRARALINRYKLAGKSYILELQDVDVTGEWGDYVCEKITVFRIVDADGVIRNSILFDFDGNLVTALTLPLSIQPPDTSAVTVTGPGGGAIGGGINIVIGELIGISRQLTITVDPLASGSSNRAWLLEFHCDLEELVFTVYQNDV